MVRGRMPGARHAGPDGEKNAVGPGENPARRLAPLGDDVGKEPVDLRARRVGRQVVEREDGVLVLEHILVRRALDPLEGVGVVGPLAHDVGEHEVGRGGKIPAELGRRVGRVEEEAGGAVLRGPPGQVPAVVLDIGQVAPRRADGELGGDVGVGPGGLAVGDARAAAGRLERAQHVGLAAVRGDAADHRQARECLERAERHVVGLGELEAEGRAAEEEPAELGGGAGVLAGVEDLVVFLAAVGADPDAVQVLGGPVHQEHLQHHPGFFPQVRILGVLVEAGEAEEVEVVVVGGVVLVHAPRGGGVDPPLDPGGGLLLRLPGGGPVGQRRALRPGLPEEIAGGAELQHVVVGEAEVRREAGREPRADLGHQRGRELGPEAEHGVHERIGLEAAPLGLGVGDRVGQVAEAGGGVVARGELHDAQVDPHAGVHAGLPRLAGHGLAGGGAALAELGAVGVVVGPWSRDGGEAGADQHGAPEGREGRGERAQGFHRGQG